MKRYIVLAALVYPIFLAVGAGQEQGTTVSNSQPIGGQGPDGKLRHIQTNSLGQLETTATLTTPDGGVDVHVTSGSVSVSNTLKVRPEDADGGVQHAIVDSSALPTGAATSAKQPALGTAGSPSTDVISVQGTVGGTPVNVNVGTAPPLELTDGTIADIADAMSRTQPVQIAGGTVELGSTSVTAIGNAAASHTYTVQLVDNTEVRIRDEVANTCVSSEILVDVTSTAVPAVPLILRREFCIQNQGPNPIYCSCGAAAPVVGSTMQIPADPGFIWCRRISNGACPMRCISSVKQIAKFATTMSECN